MSLDPSSSNNVKQVVPFFAVANMAASLRYYVDGLGFVIKNKWIDAGQLRWCWLEIGSAAIMLQEWRAEGHDSWKPDGKVGLGVTITFQCLDALAIYHAALEHGIQASRPFVGNQLWVTDLNDPDGYRLEFESPTDAPEESIYQG